MQLEKSVKQKIEKDMMSALQGYKNVGLIKGNLELALISQPDNPQKNYLQNEVLSVLGLAYEDLQYFSAVLSNEEVGKEYIGFFQKAKREGAELATQAAIALEDLLPDNIFDDLGNLASAVMNYSTEDFNQAIGFAINGYNNLPTVERNYFVGINNALTAFTEAYITFKSRIFGRELDHVKAITDSPKYPIKTGD